MNRSKSFDGTKPLLYLVATPIGNLGEFSSRAVEVVSEMDLIAAEDTRNTAMLLSRFNIKKELFSLREHNEQEASEYIIKKLKEGKKVAYVSDAGYPGISDPGSILVKKCIENDISISTINGSCAFINALVGSGLPTDHFYFYGFLPAKDGDAKKELEEIKPRKETIIFYEAPHRIKRTIKLINDVLGSRDATIARELTKINEEFIRGSLNELSTMDFSTLKGEMVIVISGNKEENLIDESKILNRINFFLSKGLSKKDTAEIVSEEFNINKNTIKDYLPK